MNRKILLSMFLLVVAMMTTVVKSQQPYGGCWHPDYVNTWAPANDPDAKFNRSTIPLQPRIVETNANAIKANQYQFVDGQVAACLTMHPMCSQCPSQGADNFTGYNPTYWQYMDLLIWWGGSAGEGIIIPPSAPVTDIAHLHGVKVLGQVFFPPTVFGGSSAWVSQMLTKTGGIYPYARKMADIAHYYGFDGWFINEETIGAVGDWPNWFADYMTYCQQQGYQNQELQWYNASTTISDIVRKPNSSMFLNYGSPTPTTISNTKTTMLGWGITGADYFRKAYFGIEVAQAGLDGNTTYFKNLFGTTAHNGSIDLFNPEEHTWKQIVKDIWNNSGNNGATAYAAMKTSFEKEGRYFVNYEGTNRANPSNTTLRAGNYFPGMSCGVLERSAIQSKPFVTSFSAGLGKHRFVNGEQKGTQDWYHRGMQDVLPTWRWWCSVGQVLNFDYNWDDAYNFGTSLKVSGNITANTDYLTRLYKTSILIAAGDKFQLVWKDAAPNTIQVQLGVKENGNAFTVFPIGTTTTINGWTKAEIDLTSLAGKTVTIIALNFRSPSAGAYNLKLGQLGILPAGYAPTQPLVTDLTVQNQLGSTGGDIRLTWTAPAVATDIHHYNVYMERNGVKKLVGQTRNEGFYIPRFVRNGLSETSVKVFVSTVTKDLLESSTQVEQTINFPALELPVVSLKASKTLILMNEEITITARATNFPTTYEWTLPTNCTKVSQTDNNVVVKFTAEGTYDITVKVTNTEGFTTKTENNFIVVSASKVAILNNVSKLKTVVSWSSCMTGPGECPDKWLIDGVTVPGSVSQKWCAGGAKEHEVVIDLRDSYQIFKFSIYDCGHKENASDNLKNYRVYLSLDNTTWTEAVNEQGVPATATYNTKTDWIKPTLGRYVKFVPYDPDMPITIRIWEFEVYGLQGGPTIGTLNNITSNVSAMTPVATTYVLDESQAPNFSISAVSANPSQAAVSNLTYASGNISFNVTAAETTGKTTITVTLVNGSWIKTKTFDVTVVDPTMVNLLTGKICTYYDVYQGSWYVDGTTPLITDGDLTTSKGNQTYTDIDPNLKWDIDAGAVYRFDTFEVKTDGKETKLYIFIGTNKDNAVQVKEVPGNSSGEYVISIPPTSGSYVSIRTYKSPFSNYEEFKMYEIAAYDTHVSVPELKVQPAEADIYPNPVSHYGHLRISSQVSDLIQISSLQGTLLKEVRSTGVETLLSMIDFSAGSYLVSVTGIDGSKKISKVIVY